ncbi:heme biosynthesis protein NirGH [Halococcus morrhuae DSM 1307]|uniref:siroheme decarboxylase n=1 Tax=Halococcus morrhuae DSM 1307 TaxID=931277 RepID=M0M3S9_HALMO|nr:Lrp/AsnC family transcriptional regulator [Halococcus morrhuae]EMA40366.1 heme biosynthesis protein NirGH [Halococcus morrhuae DSM 1307]
MTNADAPVALNERERAIINAFQGGFPVVERPFEPAARALTERGIDITADELRDEIRRLDEEGTLSRFGALIDAEAIGGTATLVAMHAPEERFDEIAEQVNAHREVAHNYEREHPHLNMWFVVSVAGEARSTSDASGGTASENVEGVLTAIENETGQETYNLPKQREFRVEAKFLLDGPISDGDLDLSEPGPDVEPSGRGSLTPAERDLVIELQGGLPLTETPYADVAGAIGQDVEWVVETINRFLAEGKLRRVGVVPNHYALGYTENGMTVWDVPDELISEVGPAIAELEFVTHCYERPRHEGVWPYDFFAMTHGRSEAESERRIEQVRERMGDFFDVGDEDWDTLFSTRILKKTGIRMDERVAANTDAASEENEL